MTNGSFIIQWTKTTDPTIKYDIRWQNFVNPAWQDIATGLDSTTGSYTHTFTPLPDTASTDRWFCVDMRAVKGDLASAWISETGQQACAQMSQGVVVVPPPPPPPPPPPDPTPPAAGAWNIKAGKLNIDTATRTITLTFTV